MLLVVPLPLHTDTIPAIVDAFATAAALNTTCNITNNN